MRARLIKFRVWNKELNRYQPYSCCNWSLNSIFEDGAAIFEQFTGLLDENGAEIYEGDIVQHISNVQTPPPNYSVYFEGASFLYGHGWDFDASGGGMKVIGNIHQNSKLLKQKLYGN